MMKNIQVHVSPTRIMRVLGLIVLLLVLLSMISVALQFRMGGERYIFTLFNLDREFNFPNLAKSLLWFFSAVLSFFISLSPELRGKSGRLQWKGLGIVFIYLAVDDILRLHEQVSRPIRNLTGLGGVLHFAWVLPALFLVVLLALLYIKFFFSLPPRFRRRFVIAALIYVGGAAGFELLNGWILTHHGQESIVYIVSTQLEEIFELGGQLFLVATLLYYIEDSLGFRRMEILINRRSTEIENLQEDKRVTPNIENQ